MCEPMISRLIFKLDASLGPEKIGEIDSCRKYPFEVGMIFHLLTLSLLFENLQKLSVIVFLKSAQIRLQIWVRTVCMKVKFIF